MKLTLLAIGLCVWVITAPGRAEPVSVSQSRDSIEIGRAIYRYGRLPSGKPLQGERLSGLLVSGAEAACVNCHRRSGLGTVEGYSVVPPITGPYLFQSKADSLAYSDLRRRAGFAASRKPYTDATLVRAIQEGVDHAGRPLNVLMPRYRLSDDEATSLVEYLQALSVRSSPGVTVDTIHFATIIGPNVDSSKRTVMLQVLNSYFADKSVAPRFNERRVMPAAKAMLKAFRRWQLHVWELEGGPDTWEAQLRLYYQAQPVFAVVGGIASQTWEPVHGFCEQNELPCLFPIVDIPVAAEQDFYSMYFSKGVLLEAEILARYLANGGSIARTGRMIQVFRAQQPGAAAAQELGAALRRHGWIVEDHVIGDSRLESDKLRATMSREDAAITLVLWLGEEDLRTVAAIRRQSMPFSRVYLSGTLSGGGPALLPPAWKARAALVYPFELPDLLADRLAPLQALLKRRGIGPAEERIQAQAYFAAAVLSEGMAQLANNYLRDYLIERIEMMVGRPLPGSVYPRLGLGQGQRFASKGGYIVRFASPKSHRLVAESGWIVP